MDEEKKRSTCLRIEKSIDIAQETEEKRKKRNNIHMRGETAHIIRIKQTLRDCIGRTRPFTLPSHDLYSDG